MKNKTHKKSELTAFINLILSAKIPKLSLIFGLISSIITTLVSLIMPLLMKNLVDNFSISSFSIPLAISIVMTFITQAIIGGISLYLLTTVGQKVVASLRYNLWTKILRLPVKYFDNVSNGKIISRVITDTGIVRGLISNHFPQFIISVISIIGSVLILLIIDWKMTLTMLVIVPIISIVVIPLGRKSETISYKLQDETAIFTGHVQQTVSEIRLMKSSTAEHKEESRGLSGINNILDLGLKQAQVFALVGPIIRSCTMFVSVLVIGYGGIRVTNGTMSTGTLVAFLLYVIQIISPITSFTTFFTEFYKAKGATKRIIEILDLLPEELQKGIKKDITNEPISFLDIFFSYNKKDFILKDISFTIGAGETVAFVGPSGSGKTTIFGLIEQFYSQDFGDILIGDTPIKYISLKSWRSQIGYVSQENAMIEGTIRENLCYGLTNTHEFSDEYLLEISKLAYAYEFINHFASGLDTKVGERGVKLSGGQRQRIAIARVLLKDPKILMLDEATASLDSQSEKMVQQALKRLMKGRTTLLIAHRLSTVIDANKIIFIENGEITGVGSHQELSKEHKLYNEFVKQQLA